MNMDYIAGWFDGEGTVHYSKLNKHFLLSFPNTDEKVIVCILEYLNKYYGVTSRITSYAPKQRGVNPYKIMYRIMITRQKEVVRVSEDLVNRCVTKKEKLKELLEYEKDHIAKNWVRWSEDEKLFIINNYPKMNVTAIAKHLGRSRASTENEIERLEVRNKTKRKIY